MNDLLKTIFDYSNPSSQKNLSYCSKQLKNIYLNSINTEDLDIYYDAIKYDNIEIFKLFDIDITFKILKKSINSPKILSLIINERIIISPKDEYRAIRKIIKKAPLKVIKYIMKFDINSDIERSFYEILHRHTSTHRLINKVIKIIDERQKENQ